MNKNQQIDPNWAKLQKLFSTDKIVTQEDVMALADAVANVLKLSIDKVETTNANTKKMVEKMVVDLITKQEDLQQKIEDAQEKAEAEAKQYQELKDALTNVQKMCDGVMNNMPEDVEPLDEEALTQRILEQVTEPVEVKAEDVRDLLEGLAGDERLEATAIKGLEELFAKQQRPLFIGRNGGGVQSIVAGTGITITSSMAKGKGVITINSTGGGGGGGGNMGIGNAITGATAGSVLFVNSTGQLGEDNTNFYWDYTNTRLNIGAKTPDFTTVTNSLNLSRNGQALVLAGGYGGGTGGAFFGLRANNVIGSPTAVTLGNNLLTLGGGGYDGAAWSTNQGGIRVVASQTWSNSAKGAGLLFSTTVNDTTIVTDFGALTNKGYFGLGSTAPVSRLQISGNTSINSALSNRGFAFSVDTITVNDDVSTGTVGIFSAGSFFHPTVTATSATTYTDAQTLYISGAPIASTNVTFTNSWALRIFAGFSGFGGSISPTINGNSDLGFTTIGWGNAYFASTKKLDWGNGNTILTHSTGILTLGTGTLKITTPTNTTTSVATIDAAQTLTNKRKQPRVNSQASTATLIPEIDTYDVFRITALAVALNIANHSTSTPVDGEQIKISILDNGTSRALTFGTNYVAKGGVIPPSTTLPGKNLTLILEWNANLSKYNLLFMAREL